MYCSLDDVFALLPGFDIAQTAILVSNALTCAGRDLSSIIAPRYIIDMQHIPPALTECCALLAAVYAIGMSYTGGGEDGLPALLQFYQQRYESILKNIVDGVLLDADGNPVTAAATGLQSGIWMAPMRKSCAGGGDADSD